MPPGSLKTSATTGPDSALPAGLQRPHLLLLIFILLGAAAVRLYRLDQTGLWYDELYVVWAGGLPVADLVPEAMASGHPPLYYLLMHAWLIPGSGDTWVLLLSALAGLATVWLTFLAGREMFSPLAGLWGAAFAAFSPLLVWYSREATMYSFLVALSLLSFYLLARCARRGGWKNWCGYAAATAAALMTSFLSPVLLVAQAPLYWLLRDGQRSRARHWFFSQAALAAIVLGIILLARTGTTEGWAMWTWPSGYQILDGVVRAPYVLTGGWIVEATAGFPHPGLPDLPVLYLWLGTGLFLMIYAAAATATARRGRSLLQKNTIAVAACTFILFVGPAVILSAISRTASARFYAWATPVLLLLVAAALGAMPSKTRRAVGLLVLVVLFAFTVWEVGFLPRLAGDWRGIFSAIEEDARKGDMLVCFPLHQCVVAADHYLQAPARDLQEPPDNMRATPSAGAIPVTGGIPVSDSPAVYFLPRGESWTGYRMGYFGEGGKSPPLTGAEMDERLRVGVAGARRVWLVTEDDSYGGYPSSEEIFRFFGEEWKLSGHWPLMPHDLRLYERGGGG